MQQHGRIGTIKQQTGNDSVVIGQTGIGQNTCLARQTDHFRADKGFDRIALIDLTDGARRDHQPLVAGDRDPVRIDCRGATGNAVVGPDKTCNKRRLRFVIQFLGRAQLFKPAMVHHGNVVRQHQGLRLVVCDVDKSGAKSGLQLLELDLHVLAQFQIKRTQRFIEQQQGGFQYQAAGNGHTLLLPARELVDPLVLGTGQADAFQHVADAAFDLILGDTAAGQTIANVVAHVHHRKQGQMLEHHVDRAPVRRHAVHGLATNQNIPKVRTQKTRDHAQQRCFSATRWPEDREEAAPLDTERQIVDGAKSTVVFGNMDSLKIGLRRSKC
ncbi:hypothetical protein GALL_529300 [mine drainage metagenome]|uniref:Uncharacterized protein n=1 Tax=mine drainage metagenome TaxID=410659 RepID=A0A1J5P2Y7_9ZZZZ